MSQTDLVTRIQTRLGAIREEMGTLMTEQAVLRAKTAGLAMCDDPSVVVAKLLAELPEGNPLRQILEIEHVKLARKQED
jgi:hypothetical protein